MPEKPPGQIEPGMVDGAEDPAHGREAMRGCRRPPDEPHQPASLFDGWDEHVFLSPTSRCPCSFDKWDAAV